MFLAVRCVLHTKTHLPDGTASHTLIVPRCFRHNSSVLMASCHSVAPSVHSHDESSCLNRHTGHLRRAMHTQPILCSTNHTRAMIQRHITYISVVRLWSQTDHSSRMILSLLPHWLPCSIECVPCKGWNAARACLPKQAATTSRARPNNGLCSSNSKPQTLSYDLMRHSQHLS